MNVCLFLSSSIHYCGSAFVALFTARLNVILNHSFGVFVIERADAALEHAYLNSVQQLLSAIAVPHTVAISTISSPPSLAHLNSLEVCAIPQKEPYALLAAEYVFCAFGLEFK